VKILNKRKNPLKKVLFKSFIASLEGRFFPGKEKKHVEEKQEFNIKKSLYVRSHIECENRNSAVYKGGGFYPSLRRSGVIPQG